MSTGLRKRTGFFVQIPRDSIRDTRLSLRARGLLAYLLDRPEGWIVRSETIARDAPEGREAIRSALRELGAAGYYRLERRHLTSGRVAMGTAVSETPIDSWAAEHAEFDGKAVPMTAALDDTGRPLTRRVGDVEQLVFLVRRVDGQLTDDGFEESLPVGDSSQDDAERSDLTGDGLLGTGESASGQPGSGSLGALRKTEKEDREGRLLAAAYSGDLRRPQGELPPPLHDLRTRLETVRLHVRWDKLTAHQQATINDLVLHHGPEALVRSAQAQWRRDDPPAYAQAWIDGWLALPTQKPHNVQKCAEHLQPRPCSGCRADQLATTG
ncbi:MAG: hypothetical protein ACRCZP_11460 [Phycicoccus sp.]